MTKNNNPGIKIRQDIRKIDVSLARKDAKNIYYMPRTWGHVAVIYDYDECNPNKRNAAKYQFTGRFMGTNSRGWSNVDGKMFWDENPDIYRSKSISELRKYNRRYQYAWGITHLMVCPTKLRAIAVVPKVRDDLTARLNALHKRWIANEMLEPVPIIILPYAARRRDPTNKLRIYTPVKQMRDLCYAKKNKSAISDVQCKFLGQLENETTLFKPTSKFYRNFVAMLENPHIPINPQELNELVELLISSNLASPFDQDEENTLITHIIQHRALLLSQYTQRTLVFNLFECLSQKYALNFP